MQTAGCWPGSKYRLTRKLFFFCRQKRGNIRFYKILILGNSPCLGQFFFYGTAEAGDISGQPRSQGLFPSLEAGREKALASAGHVSILHPEILGGMN